MPYRIIKDGEREWNVWKVDESGKKVEKKNNDPYPSRRAALPYFRKSWMVERQDTNGVVASTELVLGSVHFEADTDNPRFMRFHDAVLARAETNANKDELDDQAIQELAATIAGTPIDVEHDPTKNIGFFTAGKAEDGALRVDGVVWLDRCEAYDVDPHDIENLTYKTSIEAEAKTAECSVCHSIHQDVSTYCQHLKAKAVYGAKRILRGLKAVGGAITKKPAGSGTSFSTIFMVASHQEEQSMNELTASEVVEMWINSIVAEVKKREDVSDADKKRAEKEYGDVEYADEKNKKYPLDKEHVHAAWSYINMPKNAAKYSSEELATIKSRIKRAAKKYGMEISEDKEKSKSESSTKESDMADEEKKETPEEEKKESPEKEKKEKENETEGEMATQYTKLKKDMDMMCTELEARKSEVTALKARIQTLEASLQTAQTSVLKSKLVASIMDEKEFEAKKADLLAMTDAQIELLMRAAQRNESTDGEKGNNRLIASEKAPSNGRVKWIL